jgi:putative hemolysin
MTAITIEILFIILLIAGNGLLAMSEFAIASVRKVRLQNLAERGDARARIALELANQPNQFLSTVQIGITLVGILAGAFGGATLAEQLATRLEAISPLAPYSDAIGVALVVLGITYLSLGFGELVPKRLALNNSERVASAVAKPMRLLSIVAAPAVRLLSFSTDTVLRLLGMKPSGEPPVTEDEIKVLIRQGTVAGVFEEAEEDLVENVFKLGDRRVSALMTPRHEIIWLYIDDPPELNLRRVAESTHSRFPVCQGSIDKLIGVVRAKDLLVQQMSGSPFDLRAVMRPPLGIPESMRSLKVLELFKETGRHLALIIDEHGGIEGLITHHDILAALVGYIPIVGEPAELQIVEREDGSWLIDGTLLIDELRDIFDIRKLPGQVEERFQTVGGFVMWYLGHIPSVGEHFEWNGLRFEVVDMDGRRIDKVLISPL